jgi:hypothetical protein
VVPSSGGAGGVCLVGGGRVDPDVTTVDVLILLVVTVVTIGVGAECVYYWLAGETEASLVCGGFLLLGLVAGKLVWT